jgi:hypothetical protein
MKRISVARSRFVGVLAGVALAATTVMAQPTKSAKGTITAIGPSSVTVSVDGKETVFNVDAKTRITAPGGSTAKREAQAEGKAGVKVADILKVGQGVVVDYHEAGMHAASIRALPAPPTPSKPDAAPAPATLRSAGVVSAVSGNSLVIKADSGEVTFTIDPKTDVVASGAGTATRAKKAAGEKTVITDFVAVGDTVAVNYTEAAGTKTAKSVRVTAKARK